MNRWQAAVFVVLALWISASNVHSAESISADHVRISWLAPTQFGTETPERQIGILFEVDPEWHVYWRNPGDSGAAPKFSFRSEEAHVSEPRWPYPTRLPIAHLTNLGYPSDIAYLFDLTLTALDPNGAGRNGADLKKVTLTAELEWLVCKEDCIPGFGTLTLERPLGPGSDLWDEQTATVLDRYQTMLPLPARAASADLSWDIIGATYQAQTSKLNVNLIGPPASEPPRVYPLDGEFVSAASPTIARDDHRVSLQFDTLAGATPPAITSFVLVSGQQAWHFDEIAINTAATTPPSAAPATPGLWLVFLFAVIGGVLLNLMPCVFPVLSIKLFSLIQSGHQGPATGPSRVRDGLLYSAGVMVTFALLGGLFLALRAGGAAIGWGFQLQSPLVVFALLVLFWVMALSFMGFFEFGHGLTRLAGRSGQGSSFLTGVLAVFVAAPCTGPFMGAALGASATLPAISAMAIFLGLGLGLAAPFLLLSISPRLLAWLPRPGAWMEHLRHFLAFPLMATVLWLMWVLAQLVGEGAWLLTGSVVLGLAFAIWLLRFARGWRIVGWILAMLILVLGALQMPEVTSADRDVAAERQWQTYDAAGVARARDEGEPVFIDFTAAWCITCQVNKKLVLDTASAARLFEDHGVQLFRADWTRYDEHITAALAELGRNSVPVYAWYQPGAEQAQLLPQILTVETLRQLFNDTADRQQ